MHQKMREDLMCGTREARGTRNEINLIRGIKVGKINDWKSVSRHTYYVIYALTPFIYLSACLFLFLFATNTQFPA